MKIDSGRLDLLYSYLDTHPFPFSYLAEIAILYDAFQTRPFTKAEYEAFMAAFQEQIGEIVLRLAVDYLERTKTEESEDMRGRLVLVASDLAELFHRFYEFGLDTKSMTSFYLSSFVNSNIVRSMSEQQFVFCDEDICATMRKVFA